MNNPSWMAFSRSAVAAAVAIVVAAPALAQNTSSAVTGRVLDATGKGVPAATVTVRHVESGSVTNVTTDAEGRYAARGLRVGGPYTITFTKGGVTDKRDDVFLALAEALTLDSVLGAPAANVITVTGSAVSSKFNSATVGAGTNLGSRELTSLASINRNLQDYARLDPRLAQTDKQNGAISAGGQNTRFNSVTIDGVSISDTFGLESNNLPTKKQPISMDAIQSAQVNLSNYDVTQKGYTGANINAVTKSGTNELKGSVYYIFRSDNLTGNRYNRTADTYFPTPKFNESTTGFTLGGPIIKDKLFFFINYEDFKSSRNNPAFGPVGSALTNVAITPGMIADAQKIAKDTWGMDVGGLETPPGTALRVKETLAKLDWNISDSHRANVRYSKTEQTEPIFTGFSATGLSLSSYNYNQVKTNESVVAQWFADWTDSFSTELKVSQRDYRSEPFAQNGTRLPQIGLGFSGPLPTGSAAGTNAGTRFLNMGTERSRHFNQLETKTADVYAGATWNVGGHEVKGGLDYAKNDVFNAFLQDTNGNYTFRCENGTYTFAGTTTPVTVNCATADAATVAQVVLHNFRNGNPSNYSVQVGQPGKTINDGVANWSYGNTGLFLQDTWKVSKALSLNFGVRADQQNVPTKPLANTDAAAAMVPGNASTNTAQTGGFGLDNTVTLDGNVLFQPRAGFNLKLGDETRRQLRGGFGLFQGAAANVWLSNPFSNTGKAVVTYSCTTFAACQTANAKFNANPATQPILTGTVPAANVDFASPNLEQPSVWKANLAFETELPELPVVGKLVASAEWLYTKTNSGIYYKNLNLGTVTATGSDGRELYYSAAARNKSCWNANGSSITGTATDGTNCASFSNRALRNTKFNNVFLVEQTEKGGGNAITLSLQQPGRDGLSWMAAYTRTAMKEVSPVTSSTSSSNWGLRNVFNPNEEVLSNSNYLIRDRVSANMTWSKAFVGTYKTTLGITYEGRKGKPYSWTYINDLNGDGQAGNDLMYIPSAPGSGEVEFRGGATEEARFWAVVDANPSLSGSRGQVVKANTAFNPWVNSFDLRFSQEVPGFTSKHKGAFVMDFMNVGNFLNKKWGRIDEVAFPSNRSFVNYNGVNSAGKYVYSMGATEDYETRQAEGESQWAVQFTLRYEF